LKKRFTLITAIVLICCFVLVACADDTTPLQESTPIEEEVFIVSEPEQEPTLEQEIMQEPDESEALSHLTGNWLLSYATDEDGNLVEVTYSDWLVYLIEIRDDYTFTWYAYGTLSGDLVYKGNYSFTASNLVASSEGQIWHPVDEVIITYDPLSGLLQYTRVFNDPTGPVSDTQHMFYERYYTELLGDGLYRSSIVQIGYASDELLSNFGFTYEFDYVVVHDLESASEFNLVFWADVPLKDFSIIKIESEFENDDVVISMKDAWKVADVILPGEAVVLKGYFGTGMLPGSGFRFVDENWVTHFYSFIENMGYPNEPGPYRWLIWRFNGTTGVRDGLMVS
jgi:hypothetical protein